MRGSDFIASFRARKPGKLLGRRVVLIAVTTFALVFAASSTEIAPKVVVVAFGLFGDQSVFESEATGAARIVSDRSGGGPVIVRVNTRSRTDATVEALATALDSAAKEIDPDNDILALILTSHGSHAGLAVKPAGGPEDTLWPHTLAAMLDHSGVRHRVVIISACYSGIFIPVLANANTLVITAADASHPSFGCQDGAQWTYFGDAFFNNAVRRAESFKDAFELARQLVGEREQREGFHPSNPQLVGGESINLRLSGDAGPVQAAVDPRPAPTPPWPAGIATLPWPGQ